MNGYPGMPGTGTERDACTGYGTTEHTPFRGVPVPPGVPMTHTKERTLYRLQWPVKHFTFSAVSTADFTPGLRACSASPAGTFNFEMRKHT